MRNANERVANCRSEDKAEENDARNYIDMLKGVSKRNENMNKFGMQVLKELSPHLNGHPIIRSALSSAAKLEKELDEMAYSIKMVESEQVNNNTHRRCVMNSNTRKRSIYHFAYSLFPYSLLIFTLCVYCSQYFLLPTYAFINSDFLIGIR